MLSVSEKPLLASLKAGNDSARDESLALRRVGSIPLFIATSNTPDLRGPHHGETIRKGNGA